MVVPSRIRVKSIIIRVNNTIIARLSLPTCSLVKLRAIASGNAPRKPPQCITILVCHADLMLAKLIVNDTAAKYNKDARDKHGCDHNGERWQQIFVQIKFFIKKFFGESE